MIFPPDSNFVSVVRVGSLPSEILISADSANPVTVISASIETSVNSVAKIDCGATKISRSYTTDSSITFPYVVCTEDVTINVGAANDFAFFGVSYVSYNINEATGMVVQTSNPFILQSSFTFGELTISLLLIPLLVMFMYSTILQAFRKPIQWHK